MSGRRQRMSSGERKRQILDSAFKLISLKGFKSVSTKMIADDAGINEALIFRYFARKEVLLAAIVENLKKIRPAFRTALPDSQEEFFDRLREFENFFLDTNGSDPAVLKIILYAVLENYPVPDEFDFMKKGTFLNWIHDSIEKGKSCWNFDKKVNPVEAICFFMGSLIYFVIETSITGTVKETGKPYNFTELFFKILK